MSAGRVTLALLAVAAALATLGAGGWAAPLVADRDALLRGELWRALTGPLVHGDLRHLARDLVTLAVLAVGFGHRLGGRRDAGLLALALLVPTLAAFSDPTIGRYLGLSGANYALVVLVLGRERRTDRLLWWLVAGALAAKLVAELALGRLLFPVGDGTPALAAHVAGALVGLAWACLYPHASGSGRKVGRPSRVNHKPRRAGSVAK